MGYGWISNLAGGIGSALGGPVAGALGSALGGFLSSGEQSDAANDAAKQQMDASNRAMDFQRQQYAQTLGQLQNQFGQSQNYQQGLLNQGNAFGQQQLGLQQSAFAPLQGAGNQAIGGLGQFGQGGLQALQSQLGLSGALGNDAQAQAIQGLQSSPMFQGLLKQGENSILQNASATGGLRGGNVQAALAQFSPGLLNQQIQQQFSNLGGLSALGAQSFNPLAQLGQAGATGLAQGGLGVLQSQLGLAGQVGSNVAGSSNQLMSSLAGLSNAFGSGMTDLFGQQGAIGGANAIAQGQANAGQWKALGGIPTNIGLLQALGRQQAPASGGFANLAAPDFSGLTSWLGNAGIGQFLTGGR